jgi:hypothetical protein
MSTSLRDAAHRQVVADQQHQRGVGHQHDGREILDRIVRQVAFECRHRAMGTGGDHDQRVAVGRSLLCRHDADNAGCAAAIVDDDRPAVLRADPLRDEPRDAVVRSAGRVGHDDANRLSRIRVGASTGKGSQAGHDCGRNEQLGCATAVQTHGDGALRGDPHPA